MRIQWIGILITLENSKSKGNFIHLTYTCTIDSIHFSYKASINQISNLYSIT